MKGGLKTKKKKKTPKTSYNAKLCIYALLFYLQLDTSHKKI